MHERATSINANERVYISVVMPLFNKERTVARALNCILNQTVSPLEVIIINDGSTDQGANIARKICHGKQGYRVVDQNNMGVSVARNYGIELVKAKYVALLDADDYWADNHIEELSNAIANHPECGMYVSGSARVRNEAEINELIVNKKNAEPSKLNSFQFLDAYSKRPSMVHTSGVCINKNILSISGNFPVGGKRSQDVYLWLKIALCSKVSFTGALTAFQITDESGLGRRATEVPIYISDFLNDLSKIDTEYHSLLRRIAIRGAVTSYLASLTSGVDISKKLSVALLNTLPVESKVFLALSWWPHKRSLHYMARVVLKRKNR